MLYRIASVAGEARGSLCSRLSICIGQLPQACISVSELNSIRVVLCERLCAKCACSAWIDVNGSTRTPEAAVSSLPNKSRVVPRAEVTHPPWSLHSPGNQLTRETVRPKAEVVGSTGPFCNQPLPEAVTTDRIAQVRPAHYDWLPGNPALSRAVPAVPSLGLGQIPGKVSRI